MGEVAVRRRKARRIKASGVLAAVTASLMMSACAQFGGDDGLAMLAAADPGAAQSGAPAQSDLQKATEYWGQEYAKNPRQLDNALAYAKNLKAMGQKAKALAVLQEASMLHGSDKRLASEYGRLALDLDQVSVAKQLLALADDPVNPDWRVILARGTVLAKEGQYREAIAFYERARVLAPDHPSVMNNLALAYTMSGEPAKAEDLLRRAAATNGANAKVRQNLALVLGLQGKYDEATKVGSVELAQDKAKANADLLRKIVKLDPKSVEPKPAAPAAVAPWNTELAKAAPEAPALKPRTDEGQPVATDPVAPDNVATSAWGAQVAVQERAPALKPRTDEAPPVASVPDNVATSAWGAQVAVQERAPALKPSTR